jgi:hypothetical protein
MINIDANMKVSELQEDLDDLINMSGESNRVLERFRDIDFRINNYFDYVANSYEIINRYQIIISKIKNKCKEGCSNE